VDGLPSPNIISVEFEVVCVFIIEIRSLFLSFLGVVFFFLVFGKGETERPPKIIARDVSCEELGEIME